jgi:hypothetical protein
MLVMTSSNSSGPGKGERVSPARRIRNFITIMLLLALSAAIHACYASHRQHAHLALALLGLAAASSRMKVKLPGINGNMSVNLPFLLTAILTLSAAEALIITCVSTAVQCWPRKNGKFNSQQITFNLSMMAFATAIASMIAHLNWHGGDALPLPESLALVVAATALFFGQTVPVAGIVSANESKGFWQVWRELAQLSFPYYLVSAGVTSMLQALGGHLGWALALGVFPLMYAIHRSFRLYFSRMAGTLQTTVLVKAAGAGV